MIRRSSTAAILAALLASCAVGQESQPVDAQAIRNQAYQAQAKGDHATAAEAFLKLTEVESSNPDWFLRAGENLGKAGRFNDAMDLLDAASRRFPDATELLVMLAKTYHMKADAMLAEGIRDINVTFFYEDVSRTAQRLLALNPEHLEALLLHASAQFQLGELDAALEIAERVTRDHPRDYGAHALHGKVALQVFVNEKQAFDRDDPRGTGREKRLEKLAAARDRAERALQAAAALDPTRAYPRVKLGDIDAWGGDLEAAAAHYRDGLTVDPATTSIDHNWLRGAMEPAARVAMYDGALSDYRSTADATEGKASILAWYAAQAHFDARDWKKARAGFEVAVKSRPDFVRTYYYLMQSCYWSGDEASTARYALKFAEIAPRQFADMIRADESATAILRGIAQTSYEKSRLAESRDLNHVIALARDGVDEWNNYAFLCRETGKYQESYAAYERALEIEESPQLLNDAAVILQYHLASEDNLAMARGHYERAIALAESMLEDTDELDEATIQRTRIALRDARNNLRRLR